MGKDQDEPASEPTPPPEVEELAVRFSGVFATDGALRREVEALRAEWERRRRP
jgi:hypothetical protein